MAPCSGRAKGARLTHFKGYWLVVFYHAICGNRQRAPYNGRASLGSWQGGGKFWQSTGVRIPSLPLELMNNMLNKN